MSIMESAIGWLAPALCVGCGAEGLAICTECAKSVQPFGERCWRCNKLSPGCRTCDTCRRTGSPDRVYIFTDYDQLARKLLAAYKFGHQRAAAKPLAKAMASLYAEQGGFYRCDLVVPLPTATSRARERGFGHTELLAKRIAWDLKLERSEVLRRLGQARQLGASREQRLVQLEDSFALLRPAAIKGRRILLIDDVVTTGGTIIAAAKVLRQAGAANVDALLFAKRL